MGYAKLKTHSIKTDNDHLEWKIKLRSQATQALKQICVLDLFAGENQIWSGRADVYYGIEHVHGKGKNLWADNMRVIANLDLSRFNVIDCDGYGVPINQIVAIMKNPTIRPGTVIVYTAISNSMSTIAKSVQEHFHLVKLYRKVKTIINRHNIDLFYGFLYDMGVREVWEYCIKPNSFMKKYGYFTVNSNCDIINVSKT